MNAHRVVSRIMLALLTCRICWNVWDVYQLQSAKYTTIGGAPFIGGLVGYCLFDVFMWPLLFLFILLGRDEKKASK
ncbi:MAG: hypothetical protein WA182_20955 [Candidatus Sulfotelmatobacter sp.]